MNTILKLLRRLGDDELLSVSDAIDLELDRRLERTDPIPDSARRRAIDRQSSYRHSNGAAAPPVRFVGLRPAQKRPLAA
jgi:hypothetical protein